MLQRKRTDKFLESQGELCAVWVPLDEVNEENGGLVLLPFDLENHLDEAGSLGSCPCNTIYREDLEKKKGGGQMSCEVDHGVVVEAKPGDVVIFSSTLFHTSGFNTRNEERRVFYCNYSLNPVSWTEQAFGIATKTMASSRKRKREEGGGGEREGGREEKDAVEEALIREGKAPLWFAVPCFV